MDRIHVHLENGARCWFTSDQHFGHSNVMRFCGRPWSDVKVMNMELIENWNDVVEDNDVVFILGDFCWTKDSAEVNRLVGLLNGASIFLLPGNHDNTLVYEKVKDKRFKIISDTAMVFVSGIDEDKPTREHELMLSHFPLATWPHFYRGTINLHGHIHSGPQSKCDVDVPGVDLFLKRNLTYDVGVDNNDYKPIEIRDILTKIKSDD